MTQKDKRRVAANKMKKKYQTVTKKLRANGTISVPVPKDCMSSKLLCTGKSCKNALVQLLFEDWVIRLEEEC